MDLRMPLPPEKYRSASQMARWSTEEWGAQNLFCPACPSDTVRRLGNNAPARDYRCPVCGNTYQLKSRKTWSLTSVADAAYSTMMEAVRSDSVPNLLVLHYTSEWVVRNLLVVPRFFITPSAIERRPPLNVNARRGGWVGCNIRLSHIAPDGKIPIITDGCVLPPATVRECYEKVAPYAALDVASRGWTLDVLNVVRKLGKVHFTLDEVYRSVPLLAALHPNNRNVEAKIRQQLQVLRDLGMLRFAGRGRYEVLR